MASFVTLHFHPGFKLPARTALATFLGALCVVGTPAAHAVTPGPIPVTVTNGALSVVESRRPFTANVSISIPDGSNGGSSNGEVSGSQSVAVPAGKRLVVETVSLYRGGSPVIGSSVQVFVNSYVNGNISAYSIPSAVAIGALFPGSTGSITFYADGGTRFLVNAFRNSYSGYESDFVTVSGYLINP